MLKTLCLAASLLGLAGTASAQGATPPIQYQPDPDSPIGTRNPNAPEAIIPFEALIGDWDVEITYRRPDGEAFTFQARWHNQWILNGMAVMQEWRGPYATGAEVRYFNASTNQLEGYNLYPDSGRGARPTQSTWFDDRLEVTIQGEDADGPLLNRETYVEITDTRFRMYSEVSRDEGASWQPGRYEMTATRISIE